VCIIKKWWNEKLEQPALGSIVNASSRSGYPFQIGVLADFAALGDRELFSFQWNCGGISRVIKRIIECAFGCQSP
jgi:hypothetical protein